MTKLIFMGTPDFSATVLKGCYPEWKSLNFSCCDPARLRLSDVKKSSRNPRIKPRLPKKQALPIYQPEKLSGISRDGSHYEARGGWDCDRCFWAVLQVNFLISMNFAVNVHAPSFKLTVVVHPLPLCLGQRG